MAGFLTGNMRGRCGFRPLAVLLFLVVIGNVLAAPTEVVVGVQSVRSREATQAAWQATADYLSQAVPGYRFRIEAFETAALEQALADKRLDFVLTNPSHYVVLEARYHVGRIATLLRTWEGLPLGEFGGVVAVRADRDDLKAFGDLRGKRIAAVGRDWLGAYQAQAGELRAAGIAIDEGRHLYFTGEPQDRAIDEVLSRRADAAFVRTGLIEEMLTEGKLPAGALRILGARSVPGFPLRTSTQLYPEWPFSVTMRVPARLAGQVAVALLNMPADSKAAWQGSYLGWSVPADYHRVRDLMRELRLPPYEQAQFSLHDVMRRYDDALLAGLAAALLATLAAVVRFRLLNRNVTAQMSLVSERTRELEGEVEARRAAEEHLRLAASVFEHSNDGIVITDRNNLIVDANRAFTAITGYEREEVLGKTPRLLQSGRHDESFYRELWQSLQDTGHWRGEIWNRRKNGECYVELLNIAAVRNRRGELAHYVAIFSDITDMRDSQERLKLMAHYDPLTRLPNRVLLADRLDQAVAQAHRDDHLLAVCFVDLDGFKPINDEYGHEVGDQLLVEISRRMLETLRAVDTVARLGGDEFVLLLTGLADIQELDNIMARVMAAISAPVVVGSYDLRVTASIGLTLCPLDDADAESLLRHADQAMYAAKRDGRNRYTLFDASQDREEQSRIHRIERIREALVAGEFVLHYQPKVDMRAGCVIGFEALIRWEYPQRGLVYPGEFLPFVEHGDLMAEIDTWTIGEALRQIERWQAEGMALPVSINISARKLQIGDFAAEVAALLAAHPEVPPHLVEFEIVESAALGDLEGVREIVRACRKLGVRFALDDFGTGYSSLSYLKRLPVDTIKIDQSFVRDLLENAEDLAIVEGIVGLGKVFERQTVGEGVETPEHGIMLMRLGCDQAQGYGISRPLPAAQATAWWRGFQPDPQWQVWADVAWDIADFPLLVAQSDHAKWVKGVVRLVQSGATSLRGEEIADPHRCRFGSWYDGAGKARYGDIGAFAAIDPVHREIHRVGSEIVVLMQKGESEAARQRLDGLFALRDRIGALLASLQREVAERW